MNEYAATPEIFLEQEHNLKVAHRQTISNIFMNWEDLEHTLKKKHCRLLTFPGTLLLLIPRFQLYDDILYIAASKDELTAAFASLQAGYPHERVMHVAIVGKEETITPEVNSLRTLNFSLVSVLARIRNTKNPAMITVIRDLLAARDDANSYLPSFAEEADAEGVYKLLTEEFDICADALPEPEEVLENIRKRQVIVIKDKGEIICTHYFSIRNNIYFGLYDVTHKNFRKKFLLPRIELFKLESNELKFKNVNRIYSWRNIEKKRLIAFDKKCNGIPDGVYIYNLVWSANKVELNCVTS